jgi:hypothetical protein
MTNRIVITTVEVFCSINDTMVEVLGSIFISTINQRLDRTKIVYQYNLSEMDRTRRVSAYQDNGS